VTSTKPHRIPLRSVKEMKKAEFAHAIRARIANPLEGVRVYETHSMGRGLMTLRPFLKGEVVAEYTGDLISSRKDLLEREEKHRKNTKLPPGGYIFKFNLRGHNYWLVQKSNKMN
jgi:hypothetical protein